MNGVKKVTIIGTSCVGKTTLFNQLRTQLANHSTITFVAEVAREFFLNNRDIPENKRLTFPVQESIQNLIIQKEKEAEAGNPRLILCDNSVLGPGVFTSGRGDFEGGQRLFATIKHWVPTYTKIFVLNPEDVPYITDNVRRESEEIRSRVHEVLLELLAQNNINYEILSGDVITRAQIVQDFLRL